MATLPVPAAAGNAAGPGAGAHPTPSEDDEFAERRASYRARAGSFPGGRAALAVEFATSLDEYLNAWDGDLEWLFAVADVLRAKPAGRPARDPWAGRLIDPAAFPGGQAALGVAFARRLHSYLNDLDPKLSWLLEAAAVLRDGPLADANPIPAIVEGTANG